MQFAEGLSDRQAADAVRGRLDWKYLLGLELADPGFDHSVLTEFRDRLIAGDAGVELLDRVLEAAAEHGLLKAGGRARTDSTIVLSAARQINGLVRLGETLRAALNSVAAQEPEWLAGRVPPEWFDRYAIRFEDTRLPKGKTQQTELIEQFGADGLRLLAALHAPDAPASLRLPGRVQTLRRIPPARPVNAAGMRPPRSGHQSHELRVVRAKSLRPLSRAPSGAASPFRQPPMERGRCAAPCPLDTGS
ncbi:transposase [Streptomyces sp. NPDC013953]|uniref:transposase n=1 Tax=Streptomyces sp. NPDC013953 TaxID=3364868 RepID=UPI0036F8A5EC